jgi:hypothetical protein
MQKPGLKPGKNSLCGTGTLACHRILWTAAALGCVVKKCRYQPLQTKDEYTLALFLFVATGKSDV